MSGLIGCVTAGQKAGLSAGLSADRIYAYLDGEMDGPEVRALEEHLASCPACREAVAERRRIAEAAESLPSFEVPDGFAASVMARIAPKAARKSLLRRPVAWASVAAGLALAGAGWVLISGRSLSDIVPDASRFLWGTIQGLATLAAKSYSYAALAIKVLGKLAGQVLEGFKVLSSFISPEVQIACLCIALALAAAGFALWRRKPGMEKNHEES
jgi:predicted anti-sigma-YlaC factor YlaD